MRKVAFLGSFGFGNLGDELCLIESMERFGGDENYVFSSDAEWTLHCIEPRRASFFRERSELRDIKPDLIVFGGGGVGFLPSIRDGLHWVADVIAAGGEGIVHNIGVAAIGADWIDDRLRRCLDGLKSFSVRDETSRAIVMGWGTGIEVGLTGYPEVDLPAHPFDLPFARGDRVLGISLTNQPKMWHAFDRGRDRLRALIARLAPRAIVPIVSTHHIADPQENDIASFNRLANELALLDWPVLCPEFLDPEQWRARLTPQRLKHIIANCDWLMSQRKHNVVHAIGAGTQVFGIFPEDDDSIRRVFTTLQKRLPAGSELLAL
jgi:hypothetical protein